MTRKLLPAACLSLGLLLPVAAARADNEKGTAVIKGKVVFDGTPPKPKALPIAGDQHCISAHKSKVPDQDTIVYTKNGNAIPYVFVFIEKGLKGKYTPPTEPVVIDQKDCMYHPHVFGMVAGQPMQIKNSDPTNHNIHSLARKNPGFNFAQSQQGMVKDLKGNDTFNREEIMVKIKCDVHAWMSTYCGVLSHPFFDVSVSHENDGGDSSKRGTFALKDLPAGDYEVAAWHEQFGKLTQKVSVKDGETKEIEFKFGKNKAEAPAVTREVIVSNTGSDEKK